MVRDKLVQTALLAVTMAALSGCRREEIRVYNAPKDPPPPATAAHGPHDGHNHGTEEAEAPARPRPEVSWTLPSGWKQTPASRMNVANFAVTNPDGKEVQVTITPLPMLVGREADVVNMWRDQLGQAPLAPEEAAKQFSEVAVGREKGKLFEIAGRPEGAGELQRIVTAIVHRSDSSWFYKLSGDQSAVETQRAAFLEFLKSISIKEVAATESASAGGFKWQVPAEWKQLAAGQMQVARFTVPEKNGAKAEVFISVFPNDTGGTVANINRWRRQLKMPEAEEPEINRLVKPIDGVPGSLLADLNNNGQQMLGAIIQRGDQWWFYKLLGGAEAVGAQRSNFIEFVKSTP